MTTPAIDPHVHRPLLIVVSGRPGSGKSTLAHSLRKALSCPLVSRDEIYEGMLRTYGATTSADVAKLSFDVFFGNLTLLVSSKVSHVAEAAYQHENWRIGLEPLQQHADVKVIRCMLDTDEARDRVIRRRRQEGLPEPDLTAGSPILRPYDPLSLGVPTLDVSTAAMCDPPLEEIIAFIESR